jgi:hypothetical protein
MESVHKDHGHLGAFKRNREDDLHSPQEVLLTKDETLEDDSIAKLSL